jgi:hypothetical protein
MITKLLSPGLIVALFLFTCIECFSQSGPVMWNGSVNNTWSLASNWTPAVVPDITSDVSIETTTNQPLISSNAFANSITMGPNSSLTVESGSDLTITGMLTVNNSASLVIESEANLLQLNNDANSGMITVGRNSSALARLDYTLWSAPVLGQNLLAFSPLTLTNRFYNYDTATNLYASITPSTNLFAGAKGYLIRMPNNHPTTATVWNAQFTGIPNNGDYPVTMNNGGAGFSYNLVGNPYPSPLDMSSFVTDNQDAITGTLYFWRETNGNTINNAYCTWAGGTFTSNGESQAVDPEGIIQTGQGFFVEAKPGQTALLFKNSQRVGNNTSAFFRSSEAVERNTIWLNVTNSSGAFSQMAIGYITGATIGVDVFDGKNFRDGTLALTSIVNNTDYVIQGRPLPFNQADIVPLSFKTATAGNYTIAIDHVIGVFSNAHDIFLKDNMTGIIHNLKESSYTFTSNTGSFNDRFELQYQATLDLFQPLNPASSIVIYKQQRQIIINTGVLPMTNVKLFDISGRLLAEKNNIDATSTNLDALFSNGIIVVMVTLNNGATVSKKLIY